MDYRDGRVLSGLSRDLSETWPLAAASGSLSTLLLVGLVAITHHPISAYQTETAPLVWLLGPAVVAMAVPIWERRSLILANWPVLAAVVCLSLICAIGSLVLLRGLLGDEVAGAYPEIRNRSCGS